MEFIFAKEIEGVELFPFPATRVNKKTFGFAKEPRGQLNLYSRIGGLKIKLAK